MEHLPLLHPPVAGDEAEPEAESVPAAAAITEVAEVEVLKVRTTKIVARFPAAGHVNERPRERVVPHLEEAVSYTHLTLPTKA